MPKSGGLEQAKLELEVATNIFNEATGDLIDPAIERYNEALANFEGIKNKNKRKD